MNNLDSTSTNTSTPTNDVQSENNPSQRIRLCDEEVNDSFRLLRNGQPAQRQNGPVHSRNGRFGPYRNREKMADDSKKASHAINYIMKDVSSTEPRLGCRPKTRFQTTTCSTKYVR